MGEDANLRKTPSPKPELECPFFRTFTILHHVYRGKNMLKREKLKKISETLSADRSDFMSAFRNNMYRYINDKEITMSDISKKSDVPMSTLNNFLYGNSQDAKLSNAIKLSRALEVSIDELVGADTIPELTRESVRMCRNLPENDLMLVRWFIRYLDRLNKDLEPNKRYVSVMMPDETNDGNFRITSNYSKVEITYLKEPLRSKIFIGFNIISEYYMPHYIPGDIMLIANDRPPKFNEHAIVRAGKYLFIVRRVVESGTAKYYSIRDGKYRIDADDVDELIGYVAHVHKDVAE